MIFTLVLAFIPTGYLLWLVWIRLGWNKIRPETEPSTVQLKVTVVITVRDEEKNIGRLLADFSMQDYPRHLFEVVVVDDDSSDQTRNIINAVLPSAGFNLKTCSLIDLPFPEIPSPKKRAITALSHQSTAELVLLTDGDCRVPPSWITKMTRVFSDDTIHLAAGPVVYRDSRSFLDYFQLFELSALAVTSAATIHYGWPTMCNGANLGFRRQTFLGVNGYHGNEKIISGDDEFLLAKIKEKHPGSIRYVKSIQALVDTVPSQNIPQVFRQRIRWAGKWKNHLNPHLQGLAVFIFTFHLSLLLFTGYSLVTGYWILWVLVLWTAKGFLEYLLIRDYLAFAGLKIKKLPAVGSSLIYSFYALLFGMLSFTRTFTWKGRKYY